MLPTVLQLISLCLSECLRFAGLIQKCLFNTQLTTCTTAGVRRAHPFLRVWRLAGLFSFVRLDTAVQFALFHLHIYYFKLSCTKRRHSKLWSASKWVFVFFARDLNPHINRKCFHVNSMACYLFSGALVPWMLQSWLRVRLGLSAGWNFTAFHS